jgi:hypothetical protein
MKHCLLTLAALLVAASTYAQGTLNFVNRITPTLDARVYYKDNTTPADGNYVAQLYASAPGGTLAAVGAPIAFRSTPDAGKGYWAGETRTITGVAENGTAQVKVVAWASSLGATLEEVQAKGLGGWGESAILPAVATGGGLNPPTPMIGLASKKIN